MDTQDHYAQLGVSPAATPAEVKRAYRKLARKTHPDVSKLPDAEERFKKVAAAYEALGDADRRAAYDESMQRRARAPLGGRRHGHDGRAGGAPAEPGEPAAWSDDSDPGSMFDALLRRHAAASQRPRAGEDQHAQVQIALQDSYRGGTLAVTLQGPVHDGAGRARSHESHIEITIPRGIRAGQRLRLAGQGGTGANGGAAGDLYIEVDFAPDARWQADGRDVLMTLPVAPWEAALGAQIGVATPDAHIELNVPAGSRPGSRLRLKGRGLPGTPAGDLYAVLAVAWPPATTAAAQDGYRRLAEACAGFDARAEPAAADQATSSE